MNATARKAFAQTEISSKLLKALKHPVREYTNIFYQPGNSVYYKLPDDQGGSCYSDDKVVIICHGSVLQRVHPCRLQKVHNTYTQLHKDEEQYPVIKETTNITNSSSTLTTEKAAHELSKPPLLFPNEEYLLHEEVVLGEERAGVAQCIWF